LDKKLKTEAPLPKIGNFLAGTRQNVVAPTPTKKPREGITSHQMTPEQLAQAKARIQAKYKVELTDKDVDYNDFHHINDVQSVKVEITNEIFKEKKGRFSRGKSKFLNDPDFPNSSKD
jgi:hypothetical protein